MALKIFFLGATGYIGGTVLESLVKQHPEFEYTAIIRTEAGADKVKAQLPSVKTVIGDYDSIQLLEEEASKADIVINIANSDCEAPAHALNRGLSKRSSASNKPSYLIHTSGAAILNDHATRGFGLEISDHIYNDWEKLSEVTHDIPDSALHRNVDKIVLSANKLNSNLKTAIVCPPCIYGFGTGTGNKLSVQIPLLIKKSVERKQAIKINGGKSMWGCVHVSEVAELYVKLVEEAAAGQEGKATWGPDEGYYFAENGEFIWGDVSHAIAQIGKSKGYFETDEVESLSIEEIDKISELLKLATGSNARNKAIRARRLLGWEPKLTAEDLFSSLADTFDAVVKAG